LVRSAAQAGYRTLLIDCDLRNPSVSRMLNRASGVDLLSFCERGDWRDVDAAAETDPTSGMRFIPTAGRSRSPQDLLSSLAMREFLSRIRHQYQLIVLDASPILVANDALVLSRLADETIFLVRWGATPRSVALHALRMLAREGASVAGTVLCQVDLRKYRLYGRAESGFVLARYSSYYGT
jgi:Mrp family chromosome partitioning ATPase